MSFIKRSIAKLELNGDDAPSWLEKADDSKVETTADSTTSQESDDKESE